MTFKRITFLSFGLIALCNAAVNAKSLELPAIQVVPIQDSAKKRDYELYVKLPEDYDAKAKKKHPVIYIVDALWNLEVISGAIEYFVKDAILVGISWEKGLVPQRSRMRDYTPFKYTGKNYTHPTGEASAHLAFINRDVFSYVETHYQADPSNRTYYGFSVGGSFGSYIILTQPDSFKNYIIGSPATLFGDNFIHEHASISKLIPESIKANAFLSVGANEKLSEIQHTISLMGLLKAKKTDDAQISFKMIENANHGQAFPTSAIQSLVWLSNLP